MFLRVAIAAVGLLGAISGCFDVNYGNCRITCSATESCPRTLVCVRESGAENGLCAPPGTSRCAIVHEPDASVDAGMPDAGGGEGDASTDAGTPTTLCHNGACFALSESVRTNLVLLLWPSNLPELDAPVSVWADQSGRGNNALALYPSAPPHVIAGGVRLDPNQLGSGFIVGDSASMDFGSEDFAVIVVAGLTSSANPVSFFRQSDGARMNARQISLDWVLSSASTGRPQGTVNDTRVMTGMDLSVPAVRAYTLRRTTDHLEVSVNEVIVASSDLPVPGASTTSSAEAFIGVGGYFGSPVDSVQAVIAVRGPISSTELNQLQAFLRTSFATGP